ncbi:MAG: DUF6057 family protein [Prevotellaceae bacterium]|nr:DUF6057 family protein [Prevotellaceae bacterium]
MKKRKKERILTIFESSINSRHTVTKTIVFWLSVWLALFLFLQTYGAYHFLYLDQQNMFLYDKFYFLSFMNRPAGMVEYLNAMMIQHFIVPYCGALTVSVLLTLTGMLTATVIRRIAPRSNLFVLSILPAIALLFPVFDPNYFYSGIIACCMMLAALSGFLMTGRIGYRLAYALITSAILFWLAGAVAFLFVVCIFLIELLNRFTRAYVFLLPLLLIAGLSVLSLRCSWAVDYRFLFLPDGYFMSRLQPGVAVYFFWICLPVLLLASCLLRRRNEAGQSRRWIERLVQLFIAGGVFVFGIKNYVNPKSSIFEELDYCARTEQWDRIVARCSGAMDNYLHICYLNLALAEKGELGDRMFAFDQSGSKGLVLAKQKMAYVFVILSDICFSMGHVAVSQQMAFEANMCTQGAGNPRMYKRLVQTSLITGAYPVAEKYIAMLERTRYYSSWAKEQRRFLWNDSAVEADPVLGMKRKCIPGVNMLSEIYGLYFDLLRIAHQNPAHRVTIQYTGALFLLDKNLTAFEDFVETFYGTEVLPVLPKSFQEAVIILKENDPDYWARFHVAETTIQRFFNFRQQAQATQNSAATSALQRRFGDTYWYYYMVKNINEQ